MRPDIPFEPGPEPTPGGLGGDRGFGRVPDRLGNFQIVREIGRGGMGVVFEAFEVPLRRRVALKVLPAAALLDPRHLQRFRAEAQALARLAHPNIVSIFAIGTDLDYPYYAMPLIEGRDLAEILRDFGRPGAFDPTESNADALNFPSSAEMAATLDPIDTLDSIPTLSGPASSPPPRPESRPSPPTPPPSPRFGDMFPTFDPNRPRAYHRTAARLAWQAAEALAHSHGLGVIHRDIKPANLLVDPGGHLWVTDFGLARLLDDGGATRTENLAGTLRYISPERAEGRTGEIDGRSDVYSLGLTLYEMLTLRPAYSSDVRIDMIRQIVDGAARSPRQINPSIPAELETIVLRAIARNPADRYPTASALADDLRAWLEDRPITARRDGAWRKARRWAGHPGRVVEGRRAVLAMGALLTAINLSTLAGYELDLIRVPDPGQLFRKLALGLLVFDLPTVAFGVRALKGKPDGLPLGLASLAHMLAVVLIGLAGGTWPSYGGITADLGRHWAFGVLLAVLLAHAVAQGALAIVAERLDPHPSRPRSHPPASPRGGAPGGK